MDMTAARAAMIDSQIRTNDVFDRRLLAAIADVPREAFVPAAQRALAYADASVETGPGRFLMTPRAFAKLANAAGVGEHSRVLDVACGSGYSSAVLAHLAASVVALDEKAEDLKAVAAQLAHLQLNNVETLAGPLKAGAPGKGPFDVIFVNGAVEVVPQAWLDQLAEGGRLAVFVAGRGIPQARVYSKSGGQTAWRAVFESAAPSLPGLEAAPSFQF